MIFHADFFNTLMNVMQTFTASFKSYIIKSSNILGSNLEQALDSSCNTLQSLDSNKIHWVSGTVSASTFVLAPAVGHFQQTD